LRSACCKRTRPRFGTVTEEARAELRAHWPGPTDRKLQPPAPLFVRAQYEAMLAHRPPHVAPAAAAVDARSDAHLPPGAAAPEPAWLASRVFAEVSVAQWELERDEYTRRKQAGESVGRPPLNPEQREAGMRFMRAVRITEEAHQRGEPPDAAARRLKDEGLATGSLLLGAAGAGKSEVVHAIGAAMAASGYRKLVITAFTGVAAAPFGAPTLQALFNMGSGHTNQRIVTGVDLAACLERFHSESGVPIDDVGAIIIDEISFVASPIFGTAEGRMRSMRQQLHLPYGGIPTLLTGDYVQKPPVMAEPAYKDLVRAATGDFVPLPSSNHAHGLQLLRDAPRYELFRVMRAAQDAGFIKSLTHMRDAHVPQPIPDAFIASLRTASAADLELDPLWRFAPVGVLSHVELNAINYAQAQSFAHIFQRPLLKWRLPLTDDACMTAAQLDALYAEEKGLWGFFVEGAPVLLSFTIRATCKMVNGAPGLQDSLTFQSGTLPDAVRDAFAANKYVELEVEVPFAVNVRVSGGTWHGEKLDDLSGLVPSSSQDEVVVPVLFLKKKPVEVPLRSFYAARHNLPAKVKVHVHHVILAFGLTDFKLQGRTLNRLIISILRRPKCSPTLNMNAFYVLVSRLRAQLGLRILERDDVALRALANLQHDAYLGAWDRGYDARGTWSDTRAKEALGAALDARAHVAAAQGSAKAAAAKQQKQARKAAAAVGPGAKRVKRASQSARTHPNPNLPGHGGRGMGGAMGGTPASTSPTDAQAALQAVLLAGAMTGVPSEAGRHQHLRAPHLRAADGDG
jgi:hypothetical protein